VAASPRNPPEGRVENSAPNFPVLFSSMKKIPTLVDGRKTDAPVGVGRFGLHPSSAPPRILSGGWERNLIFFPGVEFYSTIINCPRIIYFFPSK